MVKRKSKKVAKGVVKKPESSQKILEEYEIDYHNVVASVKIYQEPNEYVPIYDIKYPKIEEATRAVLDSVREKIVTELAFRTEDILSTEESSSVRKAFIDKATNLIEEELPGLPKSDVGILVGILSQESLGLGPIEFMLQDNGLEEIVVNNSREPIWVYHRTFGWLKTDVIIRGEASAVDFHVALSNGSELLVHCAPILGN